MVCVTLIFEAFEYVALNSPSFHNVCLEIMFVIAQFVLVQRERKADDKLV
jgi:hypothetical protein